MEHLEKQPAAPKGHVKAISKAQDNGGTGDGKPKAEIDRSGLSEMSPEEQTFALMKGALSDPADSLSLAIA